MKDFDVERQARAESDELNFTICGERFRLRSGIRPEIIQKYESITADSPASEVIVAFDELVLDLIEPELDADEPAAERWKRIRQRDEDPITLADIGSLVGWAMEAHTGRPTEQPSPSPRGPRRIATPSTDASSSQDSQAA